tara:strand:- start:1239 stop:2159 length:921 start_codon:yes stop_codon:yes gene_type:complete
MPLKIVFMGTPEFSVPTLEILIKKKFNILKVYTQPPKKSKRGQKVNASPIEDFCKKNNVNFDNPMNLNTHEVLKNFKLLLPDVVVVVAYGQIISKVFLEVVKFGFINIHASLLPKWRGAAPIQRAIINGDKKVGLTIMKIQEKLDSGPILASKEIDLNQNETHGEIEKKLSLIGADLLIDTLTNIESSISKFTEQIHVDATYAKKIDKNETKINWNLDANKVLAHIHGLSPRPGAWFNYKNERFKILRAKISSQNGKQGLIINENLTVACKTNSIQILELQREGKTKQTAKDFLLGKKINKDYLLS